MQVLEVHTCSKHTPSQNFNMYKWAFLSAPSPSCSGAIWAIAD